MVIAEAIPAGQRDKAARKKGNPDADSDSSASNGTLSETAAATM